MALPAVRAEVGQAAKIWENQAEDGEISWGMGKLVIVLIYIYYVIIIITIIIIILIIIIIMTTMRQ